MGQFYTDPSRANDEHSLPDAEVFYAEEGEWMVDDGDEGAIPNDAGWYWRLRFPGCLPDSEPMGRLIRKRTRLRTQGRETSHE